MSFENGSRPMMFAAAALLSLLFSNVSIHAGPIDPIRGMDTPLGGIEMPKGLTTVEPPQLTPGISGAGAVPGISGNGGPSGGNPPPMNLPRAYVGSVCVYDSDYGRECGNRTVEQAAEKLGEIYADLVLDEVKKRVFQLVLPGSVESFREILEDVEKRSVKVTEALLRAQVARLTPFEWQSDANRQISNWLIQADRAAKTGENWSNNGNTHTFRSPRLGSAYGQAAGINLHRRGFD
jgi:hypothetical protein